MNKRELALKLTVIWSEMEALSGGRENSIFRIEDKIYRPAGPWSLAVHQLFKHLENEGFDSAPKSYGFDDNGNEILSYIAGEVFNYPLTGAVASDEALISAAQLLRKFHDVSSTFVTQALTKNLQWMLPSREPIEVICHGDYAPYNVVLQGSQTVGIFDFDTAHPAPRVWDIAYAIYCWAPFKTYQDDAMGDIQSQAFRAKQFCDAYGLSVGERKLLVMTTIERVRTLVDFMYREADSGNEAFIANIKDGHHLAYLADIEYLQGNASLITDVLLGVTVEP